MLLLGTALPSGSAHAWVIPGERLVEQLGERRARRAAVPVRIEARVFGIGESWPERVTFDVDPARGLRVADDRGGRWLLPLVGRVSGTRLPVPPWVPDLITLAVAKPLPLAEWLTRQQIDVTRNVLGRCGEDDCFVLGGRDGDPQVWIEKYDYRVRELRLASGRREVFSHHRPWAEKGGRVWPARIRLFDSFGELGTLQVERVAGASFSDGDFSAAWISAAQP